VRADLEYIGDSLRDEFAEMSGRNLLVVGGAGFLGYYLSQSVLAWNRRSDVTEPIRLTIFDNFIRGLPGWLDALRSDPNLTVVRHDITDPLPDDIADFHYVVHAASIASPTYYRQYPIETMDANVNGLRTLLEYSRKRMDADDPLRGFLFYSSSEIYGDPDPEFIPTPESYRGNVSCTGPRACYDESKRFGETLCVNFAAAHGVPVKMARPFNNYGPGLKITDRRVIPDFAREMVAGRDIVMLSDGSPKRTFCYSADAIVGYYKVLVRGRAGEPYNIGVEEPEISMAELADRLAELGRELLGYQGSVVRGATDDADYLVDNPNRRCPVITKARDELGYEPSVQLDTGLRNTVIWYSGNATGTDA
jgi:nucleoside-diphosphate-sugar epimerase